MPPTPSPAPLGLSIDESTHYTPFLFCFANLKPQMHTVLACLTFLLLSRSVAASDLSTWARGPSGGGGQTDVAACTVEQLLPVQAPDGDWTEGGWSTNTDEARPVYDCSCPYYKARQVCDAQVQ